MEINWKVWLVASAVLTAAAGVNHASAATPAAPGSDTAFTDLAGLSPEKAEAVREAARLGLITGFPNNEYRPDQVLTRQEFAILLVKSLDLPLPASNVSSFGDIKSSSWGAPYIEAARAAGLMTGSGANFRPQAPVSNEELASVLVRAIDGQNTRGGLAVDAGSIGPVSRWAQGSVESALRLGLFDAQFAGANLKGSVTRADIAPLLVDIFPAKEVTATVTSVDGDTIMINNQPLLVTESLKQLLLNGGNAQALEGAVLKFKSARHSVSDISELEIVASGTNSQKLKLNASGLPSSATLALSGDQIAVNGSSIPNVKLQKAAAHIELNANVGKLQVDNAGALDLTGTAAFEEVRISNPAAKVTIGSNVRINQIVLPVNVAPGSVIANLAQVSTQIKQAVSTAGVNLPLTPPVVAPPVVSTPAVSDAAPTPSVPVTPPITPPVDSNKLAVEQDSANLAIGYLNGDTADRVTQSILLPLTGAQGSVVSWMSNKEETLSSNGTVTRAVYGSDDTPVTLTATLTKGSAVTSKNFDFIVKAQESAAVNKQILSAKLDEATLLFNSLNIGTAQGQIAESEYLNLEAAIASASSVYNKDSADQAEVDAAVSELDLKVQAARDAIVTADFSGLIVQIDSGYSALGTATVGYVPGNIKPGAELELNLALQKAQQVRGTSNAKQSAVDAAAAELAQAIAKFGQSITPELTITLQPDADFILNNTKPSDQVKINFTSLTEGETSYEYGKRSIWNYIKLTSSAEKQSIAYDSTTQTFKIYDQTSEGRKDTGRSITLSSTSSELNITRDASGMFVNQNNLQDNTTAVIEINLMNGSTEISDVKVPVKVDHVAPTWTGGTYANGKLTFTSTEKVASYTAEVPYLAYSASGFSDSSDTVVPATSSGIKNYYAFGKTVVIELSDAWVSSHPDMKPGSKFRAELQNFKDYGDNAAVNSTVTINAGPPLPIAP